VNIHSEPPPHSHNVFLLSPGEIHFLWWFIQGSIMNPSTRDRLRKAWGLCERHAWGWMVVEAAFRGGYMHGPAVLYEDLMGLAVAVFEMQGPIQHGRLRRRLRRKGLCLMCEEGYGSESKGFVKEEVAQRGRDLRELQILARRTRQHWRRTVCGRCAGTISATRCRRHLIEDQAQGATDDISGHRSLVLYLSHHLLTYARSFQFEFHGTHTEEDEAALIGAVGWCSGWTTLLSILDEKTVAVHEQAHAMALATTEERRLT
jgi:hypothetical protein